MLTWRDFVLRKHSLSPRLGRQKTEASFARDGHLHLLIDSGVVFFCAAFRFLGIFALIASGAVLSPVFIGLGIIWSGIRSTVGC